MHKCLVHITELNNQLIKKITETIETELSLAIEDCYLMQRPEYIYDFAGRGLINHPGKLETVADRVKVLLRSGGYTFNVEIIDEFLLRVSIKIPERYKD